MKIEDYDWKIGDHVKVKNKDQSIQCEGVIIGISLIKGKKEDQLSYTIKVSDNKSVSVTSRCLIQ